MKRIWFYLISLFVILATTSMLYFYFDIDTSLNNTVFFEMITTITAVFGVILVLLQITRSKNLEEAQFIFSLNQEYINNSNFQRVLDIIDNDADFSEDDYSTVVQMFDYFESIYILVKNKLIDIEVIDDLFCYRFFAVINNSKIQNKLLIPKKEFYANIIKLHFVWTEYRIKNNNKIPFCEFNLTNINGYSDLLK